MEKHEEIAGVTYSCGTVITVDYNKMTYEIR